MPSALRLQIQAVVAFVGFFVFSGWNHFKPIIVHLL
jgi:hypothetical protein